MTTTRLHIFLTCFVNVFIVKHKKRRYFKWIMIQCALCTCVVKPLQSSTIGTQFMLMEMETSRILCPKCIKC